MTKKFENNNVLQQIINNQAPDQQPAAPDPAPKKMSKSSKTTSVYLTADQHATLERIARELETNKHAVLQLAVRHFIEEYESGTYKPKPLFRKVYF